MLIRVSGKLKDGRSFASRMPAATVIAAVSTFIADARSQDMSDDDFASIRIAPVKSGASIRIANPRDPNAPKSNRGRKAKSADNGVTAPATATASAAKPATTGRK